MQQNFNSDIILLYFKINRFKLKVIIRVLVLSSPLYFRATIRYLVCFDH